MRAKYAKQRDKKHRIHILTDDEKFNYHKVEKNRSSNSSLLSHDELKGLLPPRRKWKVLGEGSRFKTINGNKQKLNSVDSNIFSLLKTIKYYQKKIPPEPFIINLIKFIKEIQSSINDTQYTLEKPKTYPKLKEKIKRNRLNESDRNICRPISFFSLKDKVILRFTNKFLSELFDDFFQNCSFAFRSKRYANGNMEITNHHHAIREILKFKNKYKENALWVTECDMKKFYDSVNHKIIIEKFDSLISKARAKHHNLELELPINIFKEYLNSYSFNHDVKSLNNDTSYWEKFNIPKGEFEWIEKDLSELKYYENIENERIGVPQGGALSGLIANIVLDDVDKKLINDPNLLYLRFCDDMIIMHPDKDKCKKAKQVYISALKDLKLVPHKFSDDLIADREKTNSHLSKITLAPFWQVKSKGPYKWDNVKNAGFPWIGFVGYEIHYKGYIRVRRNSLKKELSKQYKIVVQIQDAIRKSRRVSSGTIAESAINRLLGMSVGRVKLWNFNKIESEMCWKNGFRELNRNKYSVKQIKQLDRNRNKLYSRLKKELKELCQESDEENLPRKNRKNSEIVKYEKPFSYYYQIMERKDQ